MAPTLRLSSTGKTLLSANECSDSDRDIEISKERLDEKKKEIEDYVDKLNKMAEDLDVKLNKVLKRQEQEYLKGYSIYVREKEKELRDLVTKLNERG